MADSLLNECGLFNPDAIERQLAHQDKNSVRRIYMRAEFWPERVRMMQYWSDYLDELRDKLVSAPAAGACGQRIVRPFFGGTSARTAKTIATCPEEKQGCHRRPLLRTC